MSYFLDSFRFPIEQNGIRLAFLTYDDSVKIVKNLNQNFVLPYVRRYLDEMTLGGDSSKIERSLQGATSSIFTKGRPGVQKILVVFADDSSDSDLNAIRKAKERLADQGVQVILISSGNRMSMSIAAAIASSGDNLITGLTSKNFLQSYQQFIDIIINGKWNFLFKFRLR